MNIFKWLWDSEGREEDRLRFEMEWKEYQRLADEAYRIRLAQQAVDAAWERNRY